MKVVLYLSLLLGCSSCQADSGKHLDHDPKIENSDHQNEDDIERPCPNYDVDCIRRYFDYHSKCTPIHGPVPDTLYRKERSMSMPHANITYSCYDSELMGLNNGKITEFYINKKKDILVFTVEFKKIIVWCPRTVISYHRRGKEPIYVKDFSIFETQDLSITLTAQHINEISLVNAHIYTSVSSARTQLIVGPGLEDVSHKDLSPNSLLWRDNITLSAREAYVSEGLNYMTSYIQSNICDFNVDNINK